ncbi:MAG: hypothetical protein KGQ48_07050 [Bradyrhizobium sp.]|nr:hypothetical protein [Bradyrhizobium sp.]
MRPIQPGFSTKSLNRSEDRWDASIQIPRFSFQRDINGADGLQVPSVGRFIGHLVHAKKLAPLSEFRERHDVPFTLIGKAGQPTI